MTMNRTNIFRCVVVFFLLLSGHATKAQDIHLTQFYHNPILLNPAQAGLACNWRVGVNYRSQWGSVTSPYKTTAAYYDIPVYLNRKRSAALGLGVGIFNDVASNVISTMEVTPTFALHLGFGENYQQYKLSFGAQPAFRQRKVDVGALTWETQWDGNYIDPYRNSFETNLTTGTSTVFDMNTGLQFSGVVNEQLSFYSGLALFHVMSPVESFYTGSSNELNSRKVFHATVRYKMNENLSIIPNILYMAQSRASEFNFGGEVNYNVNNDEDGLAYFGGVYYRMKDATQFMVGGEMNRFRAAISYDVNMSGLRSASRYRGGFEFAIMYKAPCYSPTPPPPPPFFVCPRF